MQTCEAFSANRYPLPDDSSRQHQMHADVSARLRELASTIEAGDRHRNAVLQDLANNLNGWITAVRREKGVYHVLNQLSFDVTRQALVAEAWAPIESRIPIQETLQRATEMSNASVGTIFQPLISHEPPPTYYRCSSPHSICFTCASPLTTSDRVFKLKLYNSGILSSCTY